MCKFIILFHDGSGPKIFGKQSRYTESQTPALPIKFYAVAVKSLQNRCIMQAAIKLANII